MSDVRSEHDEQMTVFGYYLGMAANMVTDEHVNLLLDHGYRDMRDVLREASEWCYRNRKAQP